MVTATVKGGRLYQSFVALINDRRVSSTASSQRLLVDVSASPLLQSISQQLGGYRPPRSVATLFRDRASANQLSGVQIGERRKRIEERTAELEKLRAEQVAVLTSANFETRVEFIIEARQKLEAVDFLLALVPELPVATASRSSVELAKHKEKLPLWLAALEEEHKRLTAEIDQLEESGARVDMASVSYGGSEGSKQYRDLDVLLLALSDARKGLNQLKSKRY